MRYLFFLLFLNSIVVIAQHRNQMIDTLMTMSCEEGVKYADSIFGQREVILFEVVPKTSHEKIIFDGYDYPTTSCWSSIEVLKDSFRIKRFYVERKFSLGMDCYIDALQEKLKKKYGDGYVKDCIQKSKSISDSLESLYPNPIAAEYPGGESSLVKFLNEEIKLDDVFFNQIEVTFKVYIRFEVDEYGSPQLRNVYKSPNKELETAVEIAFSKMPCWKPGEECGQPKKMIFTIPMAIRTN